MTIDERLKEVNGFGPGFDILRVALAISILGIHAEAVVGTPPLLAKIWMFGYSALPMFFALSGFLVAGSAQRLALAPFVLNRASRILPALAVEICLSALVLGPLVTEVGWADYFSDQKFFRYFFNIAGWIQYELPGVFLSNPMKGIVNQSLWTVPHEMFCYVIMSFLILSGLLKRSYLVLGGTALLFLMGAALQATSPHDGRVLSFLTYAFVTRGAARLVPAFLAGLLLYQFRTRVVWDWRLALAGVGAWIAIEAIGDVSWANFVWFQAITIPLLAYLTVFAGLLRAPKLPLMKNGDYSYGIYLYGFPIQQTLIWLFPGIRNAGLHFALSLALTSGFAACSWHFIEEPILRFRKSFSLRREIDTGGLAVSDSLKLPGQAATER